MNWILLAYFTSIFVSVLFCIRFTVRENEEGKPAPALKKRKFNRFLCFLYVLPLTLVAALRYGFVDTPDYRTIYSTIGPSFSRVFTDAVPRIEKGYLLFNAFLNKISRDPQFLLIVSSIVTIGCFCIFIFKETESFDITSTLILFSSQIWLSTMNGLRQMMVASVLCLVWILWSKKRFSVLSVILLAGAIGLMATFHASVLVCIPFFLMSRGKLFNKWIIGATALVLLMMAVPSVYQGLFNSLLNDTSYSGMANSDTKMGVSRLILNCIPVLFILLYALFNKAELAKEDPRFIWMLNLVLLGFLCSVLAMRMVYFNRLRMYTNIYSVVCVPKLIDRCFGEREAKIVKAIVCLIYIGIFIYQLSAYGTEVTNFRLYFEAAY